jgi:hypothetical protein
LPGKSTLTAMVLFGALPNHRLQQTEAATPEAKLVQCSHGTLIAGSGDL